VISWEDEGVNLVDTLTMEKCWTNRVKVTKKTKKINESKNHQSVMQNYAFITLEICLFSKPTNYICTTKLICLKCNAGEVHIIEQTVSLNNNFYKLGGPFSMSSEFIKDGPRHKLWLGNCIYSLIIIRPFCEKHEN